MYETEQRLQLAPESTGNPTPSKRQRKDRAGRTSRKRYGWRNVNHRVCPVYTLTLTEN